MSQVDVGAEVAGVSTEGTVDHMLLKHQEARAGGPLAGGSHAAAKSPAPADGESTASLLHREIEGAEGAEGVQAPEPVPAAGLKLTIPKDVQGSISSEQVEAFTQYATAMGWDNVQAQAALDFQVQNGRAAQTVFKQQLVQWEGAVRADPELGGKNLSTTVATANKAMHHFDPSGTISALLKSSGHGSNPDVVRFLYKVGKALGEDRIPLAGDGQRAKLPLAERMYPNFKF